RCSTPRSSPTSRCRMGTSAPIPGCGRARTPGYGSAVHTTRSSTQGATPTHGGRSASWRAWSSRWPERDLFQRGGTAMRRAFSSLRLGRFAVVAALAALLVGVIAVPTLAKRPGAKHHSAKAHHSHGGVTVTKESTGEFVDG